MMGRFQTPLRYPGGKQRIYRFIEDIIRENGGFSHYIEPYAGGAGIALELLSKSIVDRITINDKDVAVYSFWNSLVRQPDQFMRMVRDTDISMKVWREQRYIFQNSKQFSDIEVGFSFFFLNRTNRSGILTGGVIGGNDQTGNYKIDARFNRYELLDRMKRIVNLRHRISVLNQDGYSLCRTEFNSGSSDSLTYLDPPYYCKGGTLYLNHFKHEDHVSLAALMQEHAYSRWVVSYDHVPEILMMYQNFLKFKYTLSYSAAPAVRNSGSELFVCSHSINLPITTSVHYINSALSKLHED